MTIFMIQTAYASKASCLSSQKTILDGEQPKNTLQKVLCLYSGIRFLSPVKSWDSITFFVFFVIFLFIVSL